jgi:UDP-N-acetylmuramate: L-alanyl-gamma-D-glutamyl-meso-diaminopimelate ligase
MTSRPRHVHFIGIAGRAMGGLALALARNGYRVTGSDEGIYEPMRTCLRDAGIAVAPSFAGAHVPADAEDVIVGRRAGAANPEIVAAAGRGLRLWSFPAFLRQRFLGRSRNLVVSGALGKTTTTAMLAWILEHAGRRPDYLIGGIARNFGAPARFDGAATAVLEGDEYAAGFDDPTAKCLYYAPHVAVITNVLNDHPDLYRDDDAVARVFEGLVGQLPPEGALVLPAGDEAAAGLAGHTRARVVRVGGHAGADLRVDGVAPTADGMRFVLDGVPISIRMYGRMNVRNAALAAAAAAHVGIPLARAAEALRDFAGVVDRQDAVSLARRTVVLDRAAHPRSLALLEEALRDRYPDRRRVCVLQPRATGGRGWVYQRDLPAALRGFDEVLLLPPYEHRPPAGTGWRDAPFCGERLRDALHAQGVMVTPLGALLDVPVAVEERTHPGDVVLLSVREQFMHAAVDALRAGVGRPASTTA